jgi:hypothetical protein
MTIYGRMFWTVAIDHEKSKLCLQKSIASSCVFAIANGVFTIFSSLSSFS